MRKTEREGRGKQRQSGSSWLTGWLAACLAGWLLGCSTKSTSLSFLFIKKTLEHQCEVFSLFIISPFMFTCSAYFFVFTETDDASCVILGWFDARHDTTQGSFANGLREVGKGELGNWGPLQKAMQAQISREVN